MSTSKEAKSESTLGKVIRGSCLCGGVRYSAQGLLTALGRCHCITCTKPSGAAFATNASVAARDFVVLAGESQQRLFESSPGQQRVYCGDCGPPLFKRNAAIPDKIRLRLGCVDTETEKHVDPHFFVSRKLALTERPKGLPSFEVVPDEVTASDP